jgi:hypothetical protein
LFELNSILRKDFDCDTQLHLQDCNGIQTDDSCLFVPARPPGPALQRRSACLVAFQQRLPLLLTVVGLLTTTLCTSLCILHRRPMN